MCPNSQVPGAGLLWVILLCFEHNLVDKETYKTIIGDELLHKHAKLLDSLPVLHRSWFYSKLFLVRGGAVWQLVGLITQRS